MCPFFPFCVMHVMYVCVRYVHACSCACMHTFDFMTCPYPKISRCVTAGFPFFGHIRSHIRQYPMSISVHHMELIESRTILKGK